MYQARAGVCRSGATLSGLIPREVVVRVGGVVRGVMPESLMISHALGQPSQMAARFNNDAAGPSFQPVFGQEITVAEETSGQALLFGGTLMSRTLKFREIQTVRDPAPRKVAFWDVQARDWSWLMDKDRRVYWRFDNVGVNMAVAELLRLCDPALGVRPGLLPQALGNVTRTFDGQTVSAAIGEIAKAANAFWRLTPGRRVDLFRDEALDGNAILLDDHARVSDFTLQDDGDQLRTAVEIEGGGGQTTVTVPAGATEIPVDECGWYVGTRLKSGHQRFTYTGRSAASGPGQITGIAHVLADGVSTAPGVGEDLAQGVSVNVLDVRSDAPAQATLAALLGGGYTGVVMFFDRDNRLSQTSAQGVADQNLTFNKSPSETVSYGTEDRFHWPGKLAAVNYTEPAAYASTLRLQAVTLTFRGMAEGTNTFQIFRTVRASVGKRATVLDLWAGA